MRKLTIGLVLAASALSTPALAHDDAWYIEADGGVVFMDDATFKIPGSPGVGPAGGTAIAVLNTKPGFDAGGIFGYDFGALRLEAEASYRRAKADTLGVWNSQTLAPASTAAGNASALSFMVNGLIDLGPDDGPQVFAGGGVGYSHGQFEVTSVPGPFTAFALNGADDGFAWQLLAGARYPLSDHVDIGLKYRYFNQNNIDATAVYTVSGVGVSTNSYPVRGNLRSHSAMLTLSYNFLPPPPPPVEAEEVTPEPPAPVPPTPAPVPPPQCNKGPFIVFFDWDKSDLTAEAASILDSAVAAYGNCQTIPIMLAGYTDRSGSATYNQALSQRRNASVTDYLTTRGVPSGAITSQGFGETNNRVPTADGVKELQNRRVEITYGPGSGL